MIFKDIKGKLIYDLHEPKTSEYYKYKCIECSKPMADKHHLIGQRGFRKKSERYGLTVPICRECHNRLHYGHTKEDNELKKKLQKLGQQIFETYIGNREEWMSEYHKNYLWDEE